MLGSEASRCYVKPWQCSHDARMCGIGRHSQRGSGKSRYLGAGGRRRMPTMSCSTAAPTMMEHQSDSSDRDRRIEMTTRARPPFDVELEAALDAAPAFFTTLQPDSIAEFRAATARSSSSLDEVIAGRPVQVTDHPVTGHGGGEIVVTVLRRSGHEGAAGPGVISSTVAAWSAGVDGRSHRCSSNGPSSTAPSRPPLTTVSHRSSPTRCPFVAPRSGRPSRIAAAAP